MTILTDPAYVVPPPPPAGPVGTLTWLRATVSRFSAGADHARRRALVIARLADIDPAELRARADEAGDHVIALAQALGATDARAAADAVREIVPHYNPPPGAPAAATGAADAAVARLLSLLPVAEPEVAAQDICILVQACAATAALLAQHGALEPPPVPVTRRIAPDGSLVEVDLATHPFGAGPRACPGVDHALALVR